MKRRPFLKSFSQFFAFLGLAQVVPACSDAKENGKALSVLPHSGKAQPIVVATWNVTKSTEVTIEALKMGGYALDALEKGVHVAESDPENQYVGLGGHPDRDGHITLDASVMNELGQAGSVAFLEHIEHPCSVARRVLEKTPHELLVGEGALTFALAEGFEKKNLMTEKTWADYQNWLKTAEYKPVVNAERHDTIGMVAMDSKQRLAGICSTSGMPYKMRGRVGDSPIIGAGLYVDGAVGAATTSGQGELVLRTLGSFLVVEEMRRGATPTAACRFAAERIVEKVGTEGQVGFVALKKNGEYGGFAILKGFNFTVHTADGVQIIEADSLVK